MKLTIVLSFILLVTEQSLAQIDTINKLAISPKAAIDSFVSCSFEGERQSAIHYLISFEVFKKRKHHSRKDSLQFCYNVVVHETDEDKVYYQKIYSRENVLLSEGPVIHEYIKRSFLKKKKLSRVNVGIWRRYDYENKEVHLIQYHYDKTPGCGLVTIVEVGKYQIEE